MIRTEVDDRGVATVTIDRPDAGNSLTSEMRDALSDTFEELSATQEILARIGAAKLFVAGLSDPGAADAAQHLYALSPQPKRVEILTTDDHGTDMLTGNQGGILRTMILSYLLQYAPA